MPKKNKQIILRETTQYLSVVVIALIFTTLVFHLWDIELKFPLLVYGGDTLTPTMGYKTIIETGWVFTNPSIGAPFGAVLLDYPSSDGLHTLIGLIFSLFTRDPFKIYNLYYLSGFPLASISALFVLKKLKIPFYISLPGAISFAFLPLHLLRYMHIYLASYYMIPLGLLAILEAVNGNLNLVSRDLQNKRLKINLRQRKFWFYLFVCFLTASTGVYYAFFIAFIGFISAVKCLFLKSVEDRLSRTISCFVLVTSLAITAVINAAPALVFKFMNGISSEPAIVRSRIDAEIYGLKIIQLLLPSVIHRFPQLSRITQIYNSSLPIANYTVSLGLIGVIGFLYSLLVLFRQHGKNRIDDYLGVINITCILLATIGGFGSAIAWTILPYIRAYDRINVIIGFISIAVFCLLVQHLAKFIQPKVIAAAKGKKNIIFPAFLCLFLLGVIFIDQCYYPNFMSTYQQIKNSYENDEQFAKNIEKVLPQGAMIFQLPFMRYPENGPINKMADYDPFRPYLHTSGLRWSYGGNKGRQSSDWNLSVAVLPTEQMLQRLVEAGFSGIYIDRFGYQDAGEEIETDIRLYVKTDPIVSNDNRFVFYDIRAYVNDYRSKYSDDQWRAMSALALTMEPKIIPSGECSSIEGEPGNQWIWCGNKGELVVIDYGSLNRNLIINFDVSTGTGETALLFTKIGSWQDQFKINGDPKPIQIIIPMTAGQTSQKIFIESDSHIFDPGNGDPRELVLSLFNPRIILDDSSGLP